MLVHAWSLLVGSATQGYAVNKCADRARSCGSDLLCPRAKIQSSTLLHKPRLHSRTMNNSPRTISTRTRPQVIAGIVIGALIGILAVLAAGFLYYRCKARERHVTLTGDSSHDSLYANGPDTSEAPSPGRRVRSVHGVASSVGGDFDAPPPKYEAPSRMSSHQPSPGCDREDLGERFSVDSYASSLMEDNMGILEVQLARQERLSRGCARIVYTPPSSRMSNYTTSTHTESVHSDQSGSS
ncbi:hypothetical protein B0H66DRAFT_243416 [Apodospora peruviana]|uniref:Uncharacterized protein n=1 Tax=Apodospora peruviana TaxID=516989 RepID=A0AAE0I543_9PEZI|nr:hypothetical protein B0H66DRAFT_243416 [Apodospora peruviana]